jgi:NAD+ synthase
MASPERVAEASAAPAPARDHPEAGAHAPPLPEFNPVLAKEALNRFIQHQVRAARARGVVLGLSGGIDSSVTAILCTAALGADSVLGLLLPSPRTQERDLRDARELAEGLGIATETIPLAGLVEQYAALTPDPGRLREGNLTARLRMALLYDRSARDARLVAGTGNKTEILLGYTTLWGDMAGAFVPLGDLYKTQVRSLAGLLGVPGPIREKPPTAGLWPGQTDEEELGATYAEIDALLYHYVDLRYDVADLVAAGFEEVFVQRIVARVHTQEFKRRMPLIPKLSTRTVGHDFLYPRHWPGPEPLTQRPTRFVEVQSEPRTAPDSLTAPSRRGAP